MRPAPLTVTGAPGCARGGAFGGIPLRREPLWALAGGRLAVGIGPGAAAAGPPGAVGAWR